MPDIVLTKPDQIKAYRLLAMKAALGLECKGFRNSRGSVYAIIKREFKLKGNKQKVFDQYCDLLRKMGVLIDA